MLLIADLYQGLIETEKLIIYSQVDLTYFNSFCFDNNY